jgi:hypothetical protein
MVTRSLLALALLALVATSSPGCYRHTWNVPGSVPAAAPEYSAWHGHLLFGLVDLVGPIDLRATCPQGISQIENYLGPIGTIISILTLGIFTPVTVNVFCDTVVVIPQTPNPQLTPPMQQPPIMTPLPPASPASPAPAPAGAAPPPSSAPAPASPR